MDTQYDPKHVVTRYDKHDKYTEVYTCPDCGVVGTRYYRSEYNPCPRCGSSNRPKKHVAAWVTTAKVYRVPFKWWLLSYIANIAKNAHSVEDLMEFASDLLRNNGVVIVSEGKRL